MRGFLSSALLVAITPAHTASPATVVTAAQHPKPGKAMSDERFWSIIDSTVPFADDSDRQLESLRLRLEALPVEDVAAFQAQFDRKKADAYSWDLWGAAFIIHGGASDDGFDYFRCWLISRGRTFYEAALAKPDSLASLIPVGTEGPLEFENLAYVGFEIWRHRTGLGPKDFPKGTVTPDTPSGIPFEEDEAALSRRYPGLWARFGHQPLG